MARFWRSATGWIGILAILFAQIALAAHTCPMSAGAERAATVMPCHPPGGAPTNLCDEHDRQGAQVFDGASSAASMAHFVPSFIVTLQLPATILAPAFVAPPSFFRATAPPLTIRNCCFRI